MREGERQNIGVGSYGSTPDIIARMVVNITESIPRPRLSSWRRFRRSTLTALKESIIDVMIVAPPVDFEAKGWGFNIISRAGDIFRFPYNGLAAGMKKLAERPDEVRRVLARC